MRTSSLLWLWLAVALAAPAAAQDPSAERWQVALDDGTYLWDVRLLRLSGDSLLVKQADSVVAGLVERITEIRLIRKSEVVLGAGGGGGMNALTGADDEVFDLLPLDFPGKLRAIQQILLLHPPSAE